MFCLLQRNGYKFLELMVHYSMFDDFGRISSSQLKVMILTLTLNSSRVSLHVRLGQHNLPNSFPYLILNLIERFYGTKKGLSTVSTIHLEQSMLQKTMVLFMKSLYLLHGISPMLTRRHPAKEQDLWKSMVFHS